MSKPQTTIHLCKDKLPVNGTYVVCHYTGGNWDDSDDQEGCNWKVAKFRGAAVEGNNLVPYEWDEFGPGTFFGQDVDMWFELPRGEKCPKQ